jgi:hypothetical protein
METPIVSRIKNLTMFFSFRKKKGPKNIIGITNQHFANKNLKEINGFELVTDVIKTQDSRISQV